MEPGHFIVLEGVDGAGTTTHARILGERLRAEHVPTHVSAEPSAGPVGSLLRQALAGRIVMNSAAGGAGAPSWSAMALLFAADRLDHLDSELVPNLREGVTVICDRYYHSSVAYQSTTGGGPAAIPWLREINRHARAPDLTLVLDVPPEVAAQRRRARRGASEIYDDDALQARLSELYASLGQHFPGERIVQVDAVGAIEQVAERLLVQVRALRAGR
jgi:dTMP kinase